MAYVRLCAVLLGMFICSFALRGQAFEVVLGGDGAPRGPSEYILPRLETPAEVLSFQERNTTRLVCLIAASGTDTKYAVSSHSETQKHLRSLHPEDFEGKVDFAYVNIDDEDLGVLLHERMRLVEVLPSMVCSKRDDLPQSVAIKNPRGKGISSQQAQRLRELLFVLLKPSYTEVRDGEMFEVLLSSTRKAIAQVLVHNAGTDVAKTQFKAQADLWKDSSDMVFYHVNADENPRLAERLGGIGAHGPPYIVTVYPIRHIRDGECGQWFPSVPDCGSDSRYDYELLVDSEHIEDRRTQALRLWDEWIEFQNLPKLNDTELLYPQKSSPKLIHVCIYSSELPQWSNSGDVLKGCRVSMKKLNEVAEGNNQKRKAIGHMVRLEDHPNLRSLIMKQRQHLSRTVRMQYQYENTDDEMEEIQDGKLKSPMIASFMLDTTTGKKEKKRRFRYFAHYMVNKLTQDEVNTMDRFLNAPDFDHKERSMMMDLIKDDSHAGSLQAHTKSRFNVSKDHLEDHLGGVRPDDEEQVEQVHLPIEHIDVDVDEEYTQDDREIPVLNEESWEDCKQKLANPGPDGGANHAVFMFVRGTCDMCDKLDEVFKDIAAEAEELSFSAYMVNCTATPVLCDSFGVKGYPDVLVARSWHVEGQISECCRKPRLFEDLAATFYHYHGILATRAVLAWFDIVTGPSILPLDEFAEDDIEEDDEERAYGDQQSDKKVVGFYGNEAVGHRLHDINKLRGLSMACYAGFADRFLGRMPFKETGGTSLVNRIEMIRKDPHHEVTIYNADDIDSEVYQYMMNRASANCVGNLPLCCNKMEEIVNSNRKTIVTLITQHNLHMISEVLPEPQWPTVTLYTGPALINTDKVHDHAMPFTNELVVWYRRHAAKVQDKAAMLMMTAVSMPEVVQPFLSRVRVSHPEMYSRFMKTQTMISLSFGVNSSSYAIFDKFRDNVPVDLDPFPKLAAWIQAVIANPSKYMHETKAPEFTH